MNQKEEVAEIVIRVEGEIIELAKEKAQKRGISPKKILRIEAGVENGKKKIYIKVCERKPKAKKGFREFEFFAKVWDEKCFYPLYIRVAY